MSGSAPFTYRDAGVDVEAAGDLTRRLASLARETRIEGVERDLGSFGGRYRLPGGEVLVASADGVGTKVLVAAEVGRHDTIGEDLVNHCVNDILAEGAEPLFFLDYFACGRLEGTVALSVVEGIARGCRRNGCALLGGETAEMPGVYGAEGYDLAGFIVGRVAFEEVGERELRAGDVLLGLAAAGLHTNGYSLARRLLFERLGLAPEDEWPGLGVSVADVLLRPHRSYLPVLREPCARGRIRALSHITGGGIPGNLRRVLPSGLDAVVRVGSWSVPAEFRFLAEKAGLGFAEVAGILNMGLGMIAVVDPANAQEVLRVVGTACEAFEIGRVVKGSGAVRLEEV
ncbi:MAG: phosphoribosylformylglycinamidine cyclo-ligase [Gemmatimonadota bacterium]